MRYMWKKGMILSLALVFLAISAVPAWRAWLTGEQPTIMPVETPVATAAPVSTPTEVQQEAFADWQTAYLAYLQNEPTDTDGLHLADLDCDGTPELLFSIRQAGAERYALTGGITFSDGAIIPFSISADIFNAYPEEFSLYRNRTNGTLQWIATTNLDVGEGISWHNESVIDFNDLANTMYPTSDAGYLHQTMPDQSIIYTYLPDWRQGYALELMSEVPNAPSVYGIREAVSYQWVSLDAVSLNSIYMVLSGLLYHCDEEGLLTFLNQWDSSIPTPPKIVDASTLLLLSDIAVEYYRNDTAAPVAEGEYDVAVVETIAKLIVDRFYQDRIYEFTTLKLYELPGRDDIVAIAGEEYHGWATSFFCRYSNGELITLGSGAAEANPVISLYYNDAFTFPIVSVRETSHKGNGVLDVYELEETSLRHLGFIHLGGFSSFREGTVEHPLLHEYNVTEDDQFHFPYANLGLAPVFRDENGDGYLDLVWTGYYQFCVNDEPVRSDFEQYIYLYNAQTREFNEAPDLHIVSELHEIRDEIYGLFVTDE